LTPGQFATNKYKSESLFFTASASAGLSDYFNHFTSKFAIKTPNLISISNSWQKIQLEVFFFIPVPDRTHKHTKTHPVLKMLTKMFNYIQLDTINVWAKSSGCQIVRF